MKIIDWTKEDDKKDIHYALFPYLDWDMVLAQSDKGICYLGFMTEKTNGIEALKKTFPKANIIFEKTDFLEKQYQLLQAGEYDKIPLHVKGTDFQKSIWEKLIQIPKGEMRYYTDLHDNMNYARAIGSAVGSNPISIIIPCHRVMNKSGEWRKYLWGGDVKQALLKLENLDIEKVGK